MKKSQITLIIIGFILLALMATNPTIEDHRQAVMNEIKEELSQDSDPNNKWEQVGQAIGMAFGQGIIEKAVTRDNYLIFSITKLSFGNKSKYAGIGILGKVFIKNNEEIKSSFNNTSSGMNGSNSNAEDLDYSTLSPESTNKLLSKKLSVVNKNSIDKSIEFIEKELDNSENIFFQTVVVEDIYDDMTILYFHTKDLSKTYKIYIQDLENTTDNKFAFIISNWEYDSKNNCKNIFYKVNVTVKNNIPIFKINKIREEICAG